MTYNFRNDKIILQGDTHNTTVVYDTLNIDIPNGSDYLHVGDVGLGFGNNEYSIPNARSWIDRINNLCQKIDVNCYLIIGNHDNPDVWKFPSIYSNVFLLQSGDVGIFPNGKKALFVGGGVSVDRYVRKVGFSYWEDEITPTLDSVEKTDFLISHDCPEHFNHSTKSLPRKFAWYCERDVTLMDDALKQRLNMSDILKRCGARVCISGHFHNDMRQEIDGVYYRCLDINERFEFDANKTYKL